MRGLGTGSRLAVTAWLVALAAVVPAADLAPADPPRARLHAIPETAPAEAAAAPVAAPEAAPARPPSPPEPGPAAIDAADLARGDALLAGAGRFPVIHASYEGLDSFARYAAAMTALGGRFVVVRHREIVGEIDLASGAIRDAALDRPFSPRARDYSDEPALAQPVRRARARFGPGAEVMLLVPRAVDAGLFAGIARELAARGERHADFREVEGRYERGARGGLRFRLVSGVRMDGARVALPAVFDLAAIAAEAGR